MWRVLVHGDDSQVYDDEGENDERFDVDGQTLLSHLGQLQFSILVCVKDLQLEKMES